METYSQLTSEQRYQIYALLKNQLSQSEIAATIGVHKSTVSRELRRNTGRRSLWLDTEANERPVSHESIYQYIYWDKACGGELHTHLRCKKKRKKRYGCYDRRGSLVNQVSIDERPAIVDEKLREGDWEVDTIIGKNHQQAIVSITERTLRLTYLEKVETKDAKSVADAIVKRLRRSNLPVLTITADNGREFGLHEKIAAKLNADFYFAHPYSSWERGANENTNGLVRQYVPKGTDFSTVTQSDLRRIERRLNNRPRFSLRAYPFCCTWDLKPRL